MEERTEVKGFRVVKKCGKCGEGEMRATGQSFTQWHTQYEHRCSKCGEIEWYQNKTYPRIEYEEVPPTNTIGGEFPGTVTAGELTTIET